MVVSIQELPAFSNAIKHLKQNYAKWFQRKHAHEGPVWRGRFGSQIIQDERYMYACGMYIEMNPVKAGVVKVAVDWPHSSARHYFSRGKDALIDGYEKPAFNAVEVLTDGLNVGQGAYLGSPKFLLSHMRPNGRQALDSAPRSDHALRQK